MNLNKRLLRKISFILSISLVGHFAYASNTSCSQLFAPRSALDTYVDLSNRDTKQKTLKTEIPRRDRAFGTDSPLLYSFEKEGLLYEDIASWFPSMKPEAKKKLEKRFSVELTGGKTKTLTSWLQKLKLLNQTPGDVQKWSSLNAQDRLKHLLTLDDVFSVLSVESRAELFELEVINYDDLLPSKDIPDNITVGDDLGSYEIRTKVGMADRTQYQELRSKVETYLDGKVGHQHIFHSWPEDRSLRGQIGTQYIELLDASTWYLFWRQMKRDPEEISSVLAHPYLGVYTRSSLERLHKSFLNADAKHFNNKFRMVGARSFKARSDVPGQGDGYVTDWEIRSGNKGEKREFLETTLAARFTSGDYSGLRDFRHEGFNPSATLRELTSPFLSTKDIEILEAFEKIYPNMYHSSHALSHNHVRNRIISPLLPWEKRLPLILKTNLLKRAQQKFANGLVRVADKYLKKVRNKRLSPNKLGEIRTEILEELEALIFEFSRKVRLDKDFENYLMPVPHKVPEIKVVSEGPINVNNIALGIEYSFRFPHKVEPLSKTQADNFIGSFAKTLSAKMNSTDALESASGDSHGHGISVKYKVKTPSGDTWRVEWDGVQRYYIDGKVRRAWGGHAEIVTPKFAPQQIFGSGIDKIFETAQAMGQTPSRVAGGGHVNVDIGTLMTRYPSQFGTRAILNLLSHFESNQELILFMWMHPFRKHAAHPVPLDPLMPKKIAEFNGSWTDLGKLLYETRYFNAFVGRKPKYVPLNLTSVMTPLVPRTYMDKPLDIKNPEMHWFPNFNNVTDRIEFRFFDAPTNQLMAALQIKYVRALLNKTLNSPSAIPLVKRFSANDYRRWVENPAEWIKDASEHLKDLGLDPAEFEWLLWDSYNNRSNYREREHDYEIYENFLPPETEAPDQNAA